MAKPVKKHTSKASSPIQQPAEPVVKPVNKNILPAIDLFDKAGNKGWLIALSLIFLIAFVVFKDYLLFDKVYLFKDIGSDTMNGLYPYISYSADQVAHHHFPQWSYSWGMGQNIFALIFRDPFDIFLFLAGKDHVIYGIVYKELAKILLGGVVFYYYLRTMKMSNYTAVTGSILFSFCAFMIVGGGWSYFSFEAFSTALLLLAFEQMFLKNKWVLFPIAIFIIGVSTPVNLYIYGLFLVCYALVRCFQENMTGLQEIGGVFLKMAGLGILGVMICAPFIIENIFIIMESPRGSGNSSYAHLLSSAPMFELADKLNFGTCIMRFFASDLLGSGNDFRGCQNILEAPMFYCGIPSLMLMPQVFKFLGKRTKIAFIAFLLAWLLPIVFPYFRYAFWLFTGDYYRAYSFLVSLFMLYYALLALDLILKERKISLITLIATLVILLGLLNYPFFDKEVINQGLFTFANFMLIVYGVLLYFMSKPNSAVYLKYIFLGAIIFEVTYFSNVSVNQRDAVTAAELSQKIGYNDYSVEAINYIKQSDNSFYRVDKNYASSPAMHYSLNDAMVQGYYGTSSYNSFNQGNYTTYLELMGIVDKTNELQTRWAMGFVNRPILESENRVKYILARKTINPLWRLVCDSMAKFGDVYVFRNKFTLPVGYTYSSYIRESVFSLLNSTQKDFVSIKACVVNDADISKAAGLTEFQLKDTIAQSAFNVDLYRQYVNGLSKDTLVLKEFDDHQISGTINLKDDKMMFITIPYDDGWKLAVDGAETAKIKLSDGMTGVMLKKGNHTIVLSYHQRLLGAGIGIMLAGILAYLGLALFFKKKKGLA